MEKLECVIKALKFIDHNYQDELNYITVANENNISPYYFHRIFASIVGKTITEYIRERRLQQSAEFLYNTKRSIIDICFDCGFTSHQSFSRSFKNHFGVSPTDYRRFAYKPITQSVEDIINKFRSNTIGGINMEPRIIDQGKLIIAGVSGDGRKTTELWQEFELLIQSVDIQDRVSDHCYEVRLNGEEIYDCHIGYSVKQMIDTVSYKQIELPASKYASFDIYVSKGYESSNQVIEQWLEDNKDKYSERYLENGTSYAVEYYDERFKGDSEESVVEIWIPIIDIENRQA